MVTVGSVKKVILDSLGMGDNVIGESYVASPKEYDLATELLSKKALATHEKLYHGYLEKLNQISARLDTIDRDSADYRSSGYHSLKEDEVYNRNAVHFHELYFANISDVESEVEYDSMVYMRLARDFGTFDDWQWDFIACGMSSKQGWAVTAYDTFLRRYVNFFTDGHDKHIPVGCYPIIVIDMWEHSFFRDYLDDREQYLTNMMRELDWDVIERRVQRAEIIGKALELR